MTIRTEFILNKEFKGIEHKRYGYILLGKPKYEGINLIPSQLEIKQGLQKDLIDFLSNNGITVKRLTTTGFTRSKRLTKEIKLEKDEKGYFILSNTKSNAETRYKAAKYELQKNGYIVHRTGCFYTEMRIRALPKEDCDLSKDNNSIKNNNTYLNGDTGIINKYSKNSNRKGYTKEMRTERRTKIPKYMNRYIARQEAKKLESTPLKYS